MKIIITPKFRPAVLVSVALLALPAAQAGNTNWNNTGTDFNTAGSWSAGIPGTGDVGVFNVGEIKSPNISASLTIQELSFSNAASSGYTISATAGQSLTLTNVGTGTAAINAANTSGTNTISAPLVLGGAASTQAMISQVSGGSLVISGPISSTTTSGIYINGVGAVTFSGTNTYTGLTSVGLLSSNSGTLIISGDESATTGGLTMGTKGTLEIQNAKALGSGMFTMGGTIFNGTGSALTLTNASPITLGTAAFGLGADTGGSGDINFGSGALSYSGVFTDTLLGAGSTFRFDGAVSNIAGNAVLTVNGAGNTLLFGGPTLTLSSTTANTGTTFQGTANVTILGTVQNGTTVNTLGFIGVGSTLTLSGANTYTGASNFSAGTVVLDYSTNSGTKISGTGTGGTLSLGGSVALNLNGGTVTETVGSMSLNAGANSINRTGGSTGKIVAAGITRNAGSTLALGAGGILSTTTGSANSLLVSGNSGAGGVVGVVGGNDWAAKDSSNLNIVGLSTTTSTYTSSTSSSVSGNADIVGNVAGAALSATTLRFNTAAATTIDATGGALTLAQGGILVTPAVASNLTTITGGTLKAGSSNALFVFQNNTAGGLTIRSLITDGTAASTLTKSGAGLLTLTNVANSYTGATYLNRGVLNIAAEGSLGVTPGAVTATQLTMAGGTLQFGAAGIALSANRGVTLIGGGNTIDTNNYDGSIAGLIAGGGSLTKTGAGTLYLTAVNTFTGPLTISGGAVNAATLANANALSSLGRGSVGAAGDLVLDGGFVQYTGTAAATTNRQYTLTTNGGGFDASGSSSGTLTLSGAMTASGTSGTQALTLTGTGTGATGGGIISGVISNGSGTNITSLSKTGTGTWTLSGANTYTGGTSIHAGSLAFASNFTMNGANQISLAATGVAGTNYATVSSTTGTLTFAGTLGIDITASLVGGESFTLFAANGGALAGDFTSISITGSYLSALSSNGSGIWTGSANGLNFTFTTSGANAGLLSVTGSAIPEPATYAAIFGVLALAGAVVRRRRMKQAV